MPRKYIPITERPLLRRDLEQISAKEMPRNLFYLYIFGPFARWTFLVGMVIIDFIALPSLFLFFMGGLGALSPFFYGSSEILTYYLATLYFLSLFYLVIIEGKFYSRTLSRNKELDMVAEFLLEKQKES